MPKKNFLAGPKLKAQGQRNGFDMSHQNQFTAPFGMLLPCFFQRVNPDDKIDICLESQTICDGLVKPAFMRLKEHFDYYFIPTTQLWMPFDNFITGQSSYFSSSVKNSQQGLIPSTVPMFTPHALRLYVEEWNNIQNKKDEQGYNFVEGAKRLLDSLGYFNTTIWDTSDFIRNFTDDNNNFNLFPLLCYQKVYYDFYRNMKYEDNNVGAYNVDDLSDGFIIDDMGSVGLRFADFLSIHYRWQKKDYFTQVQPNILPERGQFGYDGLEGSINIYNLLNIPGINQSTSYETSVKDYNSLGNNSGNTVLLGRQSGNSERTSVSSIRFAFAYDRLLRRMRQAGPDFDAQMLAQYGVAPYDSRHGKCTYIGGYTNNLTTKDVTNMTGESIGDLAGQINSYNDNTKRHLHYHAKEHGYIIGIHSTSVDSMYQSYRTSREVLLENRYDWFNPAFENLGLQPLFHCELDNSDDNDSGQSSVSRGKTYNSASRSSILGYVPRYSELKTHPDECHGILALYADVVGSREWNVQTNGMGKLQTGSPLNKYTMQLDPAMFNAVSGVAYNGTPFTDHFVVNTYIHSKKVSSMSVFEEF